MAVVSDLGLEGRDVELVVSELATNAVLHAQSGFELTVNYDDTVLQIEVADGDPKLPSVGVNVPEAPSGRGLRIVEQLSKRWGVRYCASGPGRGKTVWADLECRPLSQELS